MGFIFSFQEKEHKLRWNNEEGVTKEERLDLNWYNTRELACSPVNIGMTLPELKKFDKLLGLVYICSGTEEQAAWKYNYFF